MATRFKIRICTWNLGNATPPSDLSLWLGSPSDTFDVVVVGAQECQYASRETPAARSTSTDSSTSAGSPPKSPIQFNDTTLTRNVSSRDGLISRTIRSMCRIRPRRLPLEPPSSCSASPSSTGSKSPVTSGAENCRFQAAFVTESDSLGALAAESPRPASQHSPRLRGQGGLNDLRRHRTDSAANCRAISSVSPGPLSRFTSLCDRRLPRMFERKQCSDCEGLDDPLDLVDESHLLQAREGSDKIVPPPLPSYLDSIDDPLAIDDLPSNISVRLDALSGFPAKNVEQMATSLEAQEPDEDTHCVESEHASVDGERKVSGDGSDSNLGTGTSSTAGSSTADASRKPGLNTAYMLGSPLQRKFERAVSRAMPDTYALVAKRHMYEMTLLVYVHERARGSVGKAEVMAEATGLGNVIGNKGAVIAKISFDGTSFCFVSSHLAAHEGRKYRNQRHEQVDEIMRSIENYGPKKIPFLHQFDHIFWMGDLNYRLDIGKMLPAAASWSHERRFRYVTKLIAEGRVRDVASLDELRHVMVDQQVFPGFAEGALSFPPTFKVQRGGDGANVSYQPVRIPAYCDRILWHSKTIHASHVKQREYNSVPSICTSDHKPVYAVFEVVVPRKTFSLSTATPRQPLKCSLKFHFLNVNCPVSPDTSGDEEQERADNRYGRGLVGGVKADVIAGMGSTETASKHIHMQLPRKLAKIGMQRDAAVVVQGSGFFANDQAYKTPLSVQHGCHACKSDRPPCIPLNPIGDLNALMYKYVTISLRVGRQRYRQACELPMASLINGPDHRIRQTLDLTDRGVTVGSVDVDVQLCISNVA